MTVISRLNLDEAGTSVYASTSQDEHATKSEIPMYKTVRELVYKLLPNKKDGIVLDLGCNDLLATGKLHDEGYNVIGVDFDESALNIAKKFRPSAKVLVGDVNALPLSIEKTTPKVILLLDIVEHLERNEAIKVLRGLKESMGNHHLIISMPNFSKIGLFTIREQLITKFVTGKRPNTGVTDRTHKILTNLDGHRTLFEEAGYDAEQLGITTWDEGMTGDWKWKNGGVNRRNEVIMAAYDLIANRIAPEVLSRLTRKDREEVLKEITALQGLYVLTPKQPAGI